MFSKSMLTAPDKQQTDVPYDRQAYATHGVLLLTRAHAGDELEVGGVDVKAAGIGAENRHRGAS